MKCIKCDSDDTRCINDMVTLSYFAELYKCNLCGGTIEVVYKSAYDTTIDKYGYVSK